MAHALLRFLLVIPFLVGVVLGLPGWAEARLALAVDGRPVGTEAVALHFGRIVVSVDVLERYAGAIVERDGSSVRLTVGGRTLIAQQGEIKAFLDGRPIELEVPIDEVEGVLRLPLRLAADLGGFSVQFAPARGQLQLVSVGQRDLASVRPGTERNTEVSTADRSGAVVVQDKASEDDVQERAHDRVIESPSDKGEAGDGQGSDAAKEDLSGKPAGAENSREESGDPRPPEISRQAPAGGGTAVQGDDELRRVLEARRARRAAVAHRAETLASTWRPVTSPTSVGGDPSAGAVPWTGRESSAALPDPVPIDRIPAGVMSEGSSLAHESATLGDRPTTAVVDGGRTVKTAPSSTEQANGIALSSLRPVYGVDVEWREGRQWVHIRASEPLEFSTHLLADPARAVIDLPRARWVGEPLSRVIGGPVARRVRASQYQPDSVRIVIDLDVATRVEGYSHAGGLSLVLHQQVGQVHVWQGATGPIIDVAASGPLEPQVTLLPDPDRLVIDLPRASLVTGASGGDVPVAGVGRWRISQFTPESVRLVLELERPLSVLDARFYPADADESAGVGWPGYAGVWRLQLGPALRGIGLHPVPGGAIVVVEAESELSAKVSRLFAPQRILLDLPGAVLPGERWDPLRAGGSGGVSGVRIARNRNDLVRIVVDTKEPMAYRLYRSEGGERLVLLLQESPLSGMRVAVDAGHGGHDRGAIGVTGLEEAVVNLRLAHKLAARLEAEGADVILTRNDDTYIPLIERSLMANAAGVDVFLSIHNNSCPPGCTGEGTETFYLPLREENALLAVSIQEELVRAVGLVSRGVKQRNLSVLRHAEMPAVLVEVAFLSHHAEERLLRDDAFLDRAVEGIVQGLRRYVAEISSQAYTVAESHLVEESQVKRLLEQGVAAAAQYRVFSDADAAGRAAAPLSGATTRGEKSGPSGGNKKDADERA